MVLLSLAEFIMQVTAFGFLQANGQKGTLPVGVNFANNQAANAGVTQIVTLPGSYASDGGGSASPTTSTTSSGSGSTSASAYSSATDGSQTVSPNNFQTPHIFCQDTVLFVSAAIGRQSVGNMWRVFLTESQVCT